MSGIAGIYNLGGQPANAQLLRKMTAAAAYRGPDGISHWLQEAIGLGYCALHSTPESLLETQPLTDETGSLCLTFDGRVDNREELRAALEAKGARLRDNTDAEMILAAYECWGEESPQHIIGDFALAVWDGRKQQLFCARDVFGMKPFHYYCDGAHFRCSSEIVQLLEDPAIPREPNEGLIGEVLAACVQDKEETLYKNVFRLAPGHVLIVSSTGIHKRRYWNFDPHREIRYRRDEEYAEHFLDLFREVVRAHMRVSEGIASQLSGGLDSSFVVGVAQDLLRGGKAPCSNFETFSLRFPGLPADESPYIEDVLRMWELRDHAITSDDCEFANIAEDVRAGRDFPAGPNSVMFAPLLQRAHARGFRVMLTGLGGDQWFTGDSLHYADMIRAGEIAGLLRQAQAESPLLSVDAALRPVTASSAMILRYGVWPLLPSWMRDGVRRLRRMERLPRWIDPEFAKRTGLVERMHRDDKAKLFAGYARNSIVADACSGAQMYCLEQDERMTARHGIERRSPFMDRRIAEFGLAIPEEQRWRGRETKYVLRRAMPGLVPESIYNRMTKGEFSDVFLNAFAVLDADSIFNRLRIADNGWVRPGAVPSMYQQMMQQFAIGDSAYLNSPWRLWMILGMELCTRAFFTQDSRAHRASVEEAMLV